MALKCSLPPAEKMIFFMRIYDIYQLNVRRNIILFQVAVIFSRKRFYFFFPVFAQLFSLFVLLGKGPVIRHGSLKPNTSRLSEYLHIKAEIIFKNLFKPANFHSRRQGNRSAVMQSPAVSYRF